MLGEQKQAYNLQEALQKEGLESYRDSQSESEEEVDKANVRIMANDNTPKVTSKPSLDDYELTMDELGEAFEELSHNYDFLKKKYLKMKKMNFLKIKLLFFQKRKMFYLSHFLLHKRILMHIKFLVKLNFF